MRYFRGENGFTLLETAMVVAIVALLAAISAPGIIRSFSHFRLNTASRCLVADLRLARQLALKENTSMRIHFTDQRSYQLERKAGANWVPARSEVEFTEDQGRRGVIFPELPEPVVFDYMGRATPPQSILLRSEKGEDRTVEVFSSGRVIEY